MSEIIAVESDVSISFSDDFPKLDHEDKSEYPWVEFKLPQNCEMNYLKVLRRSQPNLLKEDSKQVVEKKFVGANREIQLPNGNRLNQVADDIMMRYLKYGRLDNTTKIARKTGAMKRDESNEKDINYYDQDDPFIDDAEEGNQDQKMLLPEVQFNDFNCIECELQNLVKSNKYSEKINLINSLTKQPQGKPPQQKSHDTQKLSTEQNQKRILQIKSKKNKQKQLSLPPLITKEKQSILPFSDCLFLQDLLQNGKLINGNKQKLDITNKKKKMQKITQKSNQNGDLLSINQLALPLENNGIIQDPKTLQRNLSLTAFISLKTITPQISPSQMVISPSQVVSLIEQNNANESVNLLKEGHLESNAIQIEDQ